LVVALCIAASAAVYAAIQYVRDQTDTVKDSFNPARLDCDITAPESQSGVFTLTNTSDISVYMRVSVDVVWQNAEGTVYRNHPAHTITTDANWIKSGDYYYYKAPIAKDASVTLTIEKGGDDAPEVGYEYTVKLVPELIQAEPESARDEWGFFEFGSLETNIETGTSPDYSGEY
jgi:hypothetical protein